MKSKHTLVIGGTRGIGKTIVETLTSEGYFVSVISRGNTYKKLNNPHVYYWPADISDRKELIKTIRKIIKQNGKLSHLVFCQRYRDSGDTWQGELEISLTATKNIIEYVSDEFNDIANRSIVIISSVASRLVGLEQPLGYHVAKAGLDALVRFFAVSLGPKGIRTNSISPSTILKDESRQFYLKNKKLQKLYKQIIPLGRMGTSQNIADTVSFLCSPKSAFITGQNIIVDGGLSLHSQESLARKLTSLDHPNL